VVAGFPSLLLPRQTRKGSLHLPTGALSFEGGYACVADSQERDRKEGEACTWMGQARNSRKVRSDVDSKAKGKGASRRRGGECLWRISSQDEHCLRRRRRAQKRGGKGMFLRRSSPSLSERRAYIFSPKPTLKVVILQKRREEEVLSLPGKRIPQPHV